MPDPRALANTANLNSYRAWNGEAFQRSGFLAFTIAIPLLAPVFTTLVTLLAHRARGTHGWVMLMGSAMAIYAVVVLGLALLGYLRLKAWKQAHPWTPPTPRALR